MSMSLRELFFGRIPVAIAQDLKTRPEKWRDELSRLVRADGDVHIWVGNRSWAVSVHKGWSLEDVGKAWGGVTLLSTSYLSPGHLYIWRAVKRWRNEPPERVRKRLARAAVLEAVAQ